MRGAGHQLAAYDVGTGSLAVAHDAAGRVVEDGQRTYAWDDFSALVTVTESGGLLEALQYDGLGRLAARYGASGLVETYSWDGDQMATAQDASGQPKWAAWWGDGIDSLVAVTTPSGDYFAQHDARGSIATLYDATNGYVAATADYTPEGRVTWRQLDPSGNVVADCQESGTDRCPGVLDIPFGYHSAFTSPGTGLVYFRNRWYSALANQWLSQDPLGAVDSQNLYAFNGFDAVNFFDPWGTNKGGFVDGDLQWTPIAGPHPDDELIAIAVCQWEGKGCERFTGREQREHGGQTSGGWRDSETTGGTVVLAGGGGNGIRPGGGRSGGGRGGRRGGGGLVAPEWMEPPYRVGQDGRLEENPRHPGYGRWLPPPPPVPVAPGGRIPGPFYRRWMKELNERFLRELEREGVREHIQPRESGNLPPEVLPEGSVRPPATGTPPPEVLPEGSMRPPTTPATPQGPKLSPAQAAQKRGAELLRQFKDEGVGTGAKSGQHGTPHKRAGAELIREANKLPKNDPMRDALKKAGQRLIKQGKSHNHR